MTKKILKALGTLLALLSLGTLFFPWIYAYCEGRLVSADLTATGLELTQFSAWAVVVVVLPVLLLAVVYSRLNSKEKTVFIIKDGEKLALHKRPAKGLLAGLYELPNTEGYLKENEIRVERQEE